MKRKFERLKAHQTYRGLDGSKGPGVTTVLGIKAKPALINWAYNQGKAGLDLKKVQQEAFDIGSCFHFMAECYANDVEADLDCFCRDDIDKAESAFIKFLGWWQQEGLTTVATEIQLYSSELGFGGTADLIAQDRSGKLLLADYKTSKAIYPEYKCQVAALDWLWDNADVQMIEGEPVKRDAPFEAIERRVVVRVGKEETGDFEYSEVSDDEHTDRWSEFKAHLDLYKWDERNKKRWGK
jgi:hypothetical protein